MMMISPDENGVETWLAALEQELSRPVSDERAEELLQIMVRYLGANDHRWTALNQERLYTAFDSIGPRSIGPIVDYILDFSRTDVVDAAKRCLHVLAEE